MNFQKNESLTNSQVVTMAVFALGGETKAIDIEDIAVEAFRYFPERFSWRKFHDMIDLRAVQYALKDACYVDIGEPLLAGSVKHGYMLTPFGRNWASDKNLQDYKFKEISFRNNSINEKISLEQTRLLLSKAYIKFLENNYEEITDSDFQDFTRVNEYFPEHARKRRYALIDNSVKEHENLMKCWSFLRNKFINQEN